MPLSTNLLHLSFIRISVGIFDSVLSTRSTAVGEGFFLLCWVRQWFCVTASFPGSGFKDKGYPKPSTL